MINLKLKRGLDLKLEGAAALTAETVAVPQLLHIVPDQYVGLTPKVVVKAGEVVKVGTPLFYDKQQPEIMVVSPVAGTVKEVIRGDRRKVLSIDIEPAAKTAQEKFDMKSDLKTLLLKCGLWPMLRQRPYDCIAMPSKTPKAIFISSFCTAPLAPNYEWLLTQDMDKLQTAITALGKIAPVYVGIRQDSTQFAGLKDCTIYSVAGKHPAGNVGVQINHIAPLAKGETVYTLNIQDAMIIGRFLTTGELNFARKVAVTGPKAEKRHYYEVVPGTTLSEFIAPVAGARLIAGNALSGYATDYAETVAYNACQYTMIEEGEDCHEFMGWFMPSFLRSGKWDARIKGGHRALIVSGEYDSVFPMDIYPEQLLRAMITGNLDKMIALGANEVAPEDFALCEYLCTSKIPVQQIVRDALDNLKKEIE